jgi:hypothetical protein
VKASVTGTASEQGVRHEASVEMLASAPGGSDSIVKVAVAGLDDDSWKLGIHDVSQDEQAASPRLQATTAIARVMFISAAGKSIWLVPPPRGILAARDERFAGFAQVSEGAILFGAIGPSIMSLIDGLLALVIDGSRDVLGP